MILLPPLLVAALLAPPPNPIQSSASPPPVAQEATPAEIVEDVIDEYDDAYTEFMEAYEEAETDEARQAAYEKMPRTQEYAERLWPVIDGAPESAPALTAIVWVMSNRAAGERQSELSALLLKHHLQAEEIGEVCSLFARETSVEAERFLRTVREKSPADSARGQATYALTGLLGSRLQIKESLATVDEEMREQMAEWYGEGTIAMLAELDAEAIEAERAKLFIEVRDRYGEIPYGRRGRTLGSIVESELFELNHLQVGMVAPDIEGPDLDGVDFKLSDYRGQVVFLDFWGDW